MNPRRLRHLLIEARDEALRLLAEERAIARHPGIASAPAPVSVIAVGKGAPGMLRDCASLLGDRIDRSLVVTTDDTEGDGLPAHAILLRASHPIPDERSLEAADRALAIAAAAPADGSLVVLVSGGASALVCAPPQGLSFQTKRELVDSLLRSGAPIHDVNTVRRHLSRIKGGALAAATRARVVCAIASDVIDGRPHDVGSGPACVDPTSRKEAAEILRLVLGHDTERALIAHLTHGLAATDEAASRVDARIVVGPEHLACAVADALSRRGFHARTGVRGSCGAEQLARELARGASTLGPAEAVVIASEPTVRVPSWAGHGGRAGRVALCVLMESGLRDDVAFLCASSDGVDGSSGAGGACVSRELAADAAAIHRAVDSYDDTTAHRAMGSLIAGAATGLNLTDVYVCARSPG